MIFKSAFHFILFSVSFGAAAQNLVPNPSFEQYRDLRCGISSKSADFDNGPDYWTSPNSATPDFYSLLVRDSVYINDDILCRNHPFSESAGSYGYQAPRDGNNMVGIITYTKGGSIPCLDYSEYITVELKKPLVQGNNYLCGYFISLAENREYVSNNVGMLFSSDSVFGSGVCDYLNYLPQINNENVIEESIKWLLVNNLFTSQGGERFLTIGNFYSDEATTVKFVFDNPVYTNSLAYYFIDSVFVEPIDKLNIPNVFTPNNDEINQAFHIKNLQQNRWEITIINRWGQQVYYSACYNNDWQGEGLAAGRYYYFVRHRFVDIEYKGELTILY